MEDFSGLNLLNFSSSFILIIHLNKDKVPTSIGIITSGSVTNWRGIPRIIFDRVRLRAREVTHASETDAAGPLPAGPDPLPPLLSAVAPGPPRRGLPRNVHFPNVPPEEIDRGVGTPGTRRVPVFDIGHHRGGRIRKVMRQEEFSRRSLPD